MYYNHVAHLWTFRVASNAHARLARIVLSFSAMEVENPVLSLPPALVERLCLVCEAYADESERQTGLRTRLEPAILARRILVDALRAEPADVAFALWYGSERT
jgi:hypothetical protein